MIAGSQAQSAELQVATIGANRVTRVIGVKRIKPVRENTSGANPTENTSRAIRTEIQRRITLTQGDLTSRRDACD